jgi:hypothetical protein
MLSNAYYLLQYVAISPQLEIAQRDLEATTQVFATV